MLAPEFIYELHGCRIEVNAAFDVIEIWKDEKLIETMTGCDQDSLGQAIGIARYGAGERHEAKQSDDPKNTPIPTVGQIVSDIVGDD